MPEHSEWCLRAKIWSVRGQVRVTHPYSNAWSCPACAYDRVTALLEHLEDMIEADYIYLGDLDARSHAAARQQARRLHAGWITATPVSLKRKQRLMFVDVDARPRGQELRRHPRDVGLFRLATRLRLGTYRRVRAYGTWEQKPERRSTNPDWKCLGTTAPSAVDDTLAKAGINDRWVRMSGDEEDRLREILNPEPTDRWGRPLKLVE